MSAQATASATRTALSEDYPNANFKAKPPIIGPWLAEDYRGKTRVFRYLHDAIRWIWSRGGYGKVFLGGAEANPYKDPVYSHTDKGRALSQFAGGLDGTDEAPW
jgi:hypothetical protein